MNKFRNIFTICGHDLLDQLRDLRTLFMICVLPVILYPLIGQLMVHVAIGQQVKPRKIAVVGFEEQTAPVSIQEKSLAGIVGLMLPSGMAGDFVSKGVVIQGYYLLEQSWIPPLFVSNQDKLSLHPKYDTKSALSLMTSWVAYQPPGGLDAKGFSAWMQELHESGVDAVLILPPPRSGPQPHEGVPKIRLEFQDGDESFKVMKAFVQGILNRYETALRRSKFIAHGLALNFDRVVVLEEPQAGNPETEKEKIIVNLLKRVIPMLMVVWAMVGALHPAVDLCAGEKERGTMETLLISAATRFEIVLGKFLAIWMFSTVTALLNIACLGATAWYLANSYMKVSGPPGLILVWTIALLLPLGAFFSAICLAIGSYARSTREGQYFLMPLVMVVLPLVLITMVPGSKIDLPSCFIPITGIALLMQALISEPVSFKLVAYLVVVVFATGWYALLALQWAVRQFQREEVLFREAEQFHWNRILHALTPVRALVPGLGIGAIGLLITLVLMHLPGASFWVTRGVDPVLAGAMGVIILTFGWCANPMKSLGLGPVRWQSLFLGLLVGALLLPIITEIQFQAFRLNPWKDIAESLAGKGGLGISMQMTFPRALGFIILPALARELIFRGFLLGNLRSGFTASAAVGLAALLAAGSSLQHQRFFPDLMISVFLGAMVLRLGSVWPAILAQMVLIFPGVLAGFFSSQLGSFESTVEMVRTAQLSWWGLLLFCSCGLGILYGAWFFSDLTRRAWAAWMRVMRSGLQTEA